MPVAVTLKVASVGSVTVRSLGCAAMLGAWSVGGEFVELPDVSGCGYVYGV